VVEVFGEEELETARSAGADIIQVNARDLDTLAVDPIGSLRLMEACPPKPGEFFIAASGIRDVLDLKIARRSGFKGALVGTALMRGGKPAEALNAMLEGLAPEPPAGGPPPGGHQRHWWLGK
jgi:indole-3-glycerol phosphate synthase